jgi:hypothetical protein
MGWLKDRPRPTSTDAKASPAPAAAAGAPAPVVVRVGKAHRDVPPAAAAASDRPDSVASVSTPLGADEALARRGGEPMLATAQRQRLETELKRRKVQVCVVWVAIVIATLFTCLRTC